MADIQELRSMSDGSQLRLTLKHWEGFSSGPLEGEGLETIYQVSDRPYSQETIESVMVVDDTEGGADERPAESSTDPVLDAALAYIGNGDWESYLDVEEGSE